MLFTRLTARALLAGAAATTTAAIGVTAATAQGRPALSAKLVGLSNSREATTVLHARGLDALWAFDVKADSYKPLTTFTPKRGQAEFTMRTDARQLGIKSPKSATGLHTPNRGALRLGSDQGSMSNSNSTSPGEPSTSTPMIATSAEQAAPAGFNSSEQIFNDEFPGSTLDSANWNPFITSAAANGAPWNANGEGGSSPANPSIDYDDEYDLPGQLAVSNGLGITADETPTAGMLGSGRATYAWASGTVSSYGKFEFSGGYLQIVAKMPAGNGMWPGLWLLPGAGNTDGDNYEIDLFEGGYTGNGVSPNDNFAWHLHTPSGTFGSTTAVGADLTAGYHVYGLDWVPGKQLTWYLDGNEVGQVTSAEAPIPTEPMELIMDLQVASAATASWHTVAGSSTPATNQMEIRSVQVFS